jgi:hypothetical protein
MNHSHFALFLFLLGSGTFGLCRDSFADCPPLAHTIAEAIRCQRDLCKDLSAVNEKGVSKEGIYYVSCIQNYTFTSTSRSGEPFVAEIDELQRTRLPEPVQVLSPCDCLQKLAADFPECKLKTCESEALKPAPPAPESPAVEAPAAPAAAPSPGPVGEPVSENAKVEPEGGCSLSFMRSSTSGAGS